MESLNNKIDHVENRESGMEDKVQKIDYSVNTKDKFFNHMNILRIYEDIYWRALEQNENTKSLDYNHRISRRISNQRHRKSQTIKSQKNGLANLEKQMHIQAQEAYKTLNRPDEKKKASTIYYS